jgi:hypothetical protein
MTPNGFPELVSRAYEAVVTDAPVDNIFGAQILAKALKAGDGMVEKVVADGGRDFRATLEYAKNPTARGYAEMEALDSTRAEVFTEAIYQQKQHAVQVTFSDWEMSVTRGENAKFESIDKKLKNGTTSHLDDLNLKLFGDGSADNGNSIDGLLKLIPNDPTTGSVGGIDPSTWVFWRSQQASGTRTSAPGDNIISSWTTVFDSCGRGGSSENPTDVITDKATFDLYKNQALTLQRFNKEDKARGMNLGWDNNAIEFSTASVHFDEAAAQVTPGNAYFINPEFFKFAYLKGAWMKAKPANELPNQLASVYNIYTIGQFISTARRRGGVATGCN